MNPEYVRKWSQKVTLSGAHRGPHVQWLTGYALLNQEPMEIHDIPLDVRYKDFCERLKDVML